MPALAAAGEKHLQRGLHPTPASVPAKKIHFRTRFVLAGHVEKDDFFFFAMPVSIVTFCDFECLCACGAVFVFAASSFFRTMPCVPCCFLCPLWSRTPYTKRPNSDQAV